MRAERGEAGKISSLAEGTRRLAYEYNGMVLHELYFSNLKPGGEARPPTGRRSGAALAESFWISRSLAGELPGDRRHARHRLGDPLRGSG